MTCRVCGSPTLASGLFFRCSVNECLAAHWDKRAVLKVKKAHPNSQSGPSPEWVQKLLIDAEIPKPPKGECFVYTMRLKRDIPERVPAKFRGRLSNRGTGRFYVGMTSLHPYARYLQHLRGHKSSWYVRRLGTVMVAFEGDMTRLEAEERERTKFQELDEKGFDVHGGH